MNKVKKGLRILVIILSLILVGLGMGLGGNFLMNNRERYMDNEIKTGRIDKKEDEEDEDQSKT